MADFEQDPVELPLTPPAEDGPAVAAPVAGPAASLAAVAAGEYVPVPLPPVREAFPPWSGWDVFAVLSFTVTAVILCSVVAMGIARVVTRHQHIPWAELAQNTTVLIGSQTAAYPAVMVFMMLVVGRKTREPFFKAVRWNWPRLAAPAFVLAGMAFAFAVDFASRYLPIPKSLPVDKYFSDMTGAYFMALFGGTLAPLLEELFFRGMLYPVLRREWNVTWAVLVTAGAFASIHGAQLGYAWAPLASIFVVGAVFTLVREKADSVAASFCMHCGYNFTLFAMLWVGSDHFRHLEKVTS